MEFLDAPDPVLAFVRTHDGERVLCVFNPSRGEATFRDPILSGAKAVDWGCGDAAVAAGTLTPRPLSLLVCAFLNPRRL